MASELKPYRYFYNPDTKKSPTSTKLNNTKKSPTPPKIKTSVSKLNNTSGTSKKVLLSPQYQQDDICDKMGYDIFMKFDQKYIQVNKVFDVERNNLIDFNYDTLITHKSFNVLIKIINDFEFIYKNLIFEVTTDRTFSPKSGGGKIFISKPEDWANVIMELTSLVNLFLDIYKKELRKRLDPDYITKECEDTQLVYCNPPCGRQSTWLGYEYCTRVPPKKS